MYSAMPAPRNSGLTNFNTLGGGGSVVGGPRPFSVDPFGGKGPSPSDNPTDDELLAFLHLSTQDMMTVTKK